MGCLRSLIIFSILLLWLVNPGNSYDVSVFMNQAGTLIEPFDVGKTIVYNVQISGASKSMLYTVEITVGPGPDQSVSKTIKKI